MKVAKTALAVAALLGMSSAALADDAMTVYGKLNVTVQDSDEGQSETEVVSNASRFGVKGELALSEELSAVYKIEWEVNVADQDKGDSSDDQIKARNQYVGLKGNFGEVLVGRNDTLLKQSQGKIDLFNDLEADIKQLFGGENRLGDSVTYKTPKFGMFQAGVSYITEDNSKQREKSEGDRTDGYSLALMYGDAKFKKSNLFASIAYDDDVAGLDTVRATVNGKIGDFILGGMYQQSEKSAGGKDEDGYLVNAAYKLGATTFKLQYQDTDMTFGKKKAAGDVISAGVDYKLGKSTKVFGFYSTFSFEEAGKEDHDYLGLGIEHKF
ncbi:porin [Gallaecimonas sp. GXIMD4217]|uniref:porin n=1 Tax=Gallaecimonas sp. GXIMD4217 TaxID=3131927 RepID=UPI00311AEA5A